MQMTARTLAFPFPWALLLIGAVFGGASGCSGLARSHEARKIPQFGTIDASQPGELRKVAQSPYTIEPPDELEVTTSPPVADWSQSPFVVQADGFVDLGLAGSVYVYGLTLAEAEERVAVQLNDHAREREGKPSQPYRVSVRLANNQSKYYYVIGAVTTQGRFKSTGGETVLDAIMLAAPRSYAVLEKAYLVRPHPLGGPDEVYKIDWCGIRDRGDTLTNYQVFPGDRVVVPGTKPPGLIGSLLGN
jgi:polysaccharide biosynthesis/export protein